MANVTSKDGTQIAYDKSGEGPAVILVTGATMTRASWPQLAALLAPHFTVYGYDRRGRGDSGDTQPYALDREFEDLEVLIEEAGGSAFVYGISSGACLALEAAAVLGGKISKLALYEAPYDSDEKAVAGWREYRKNLSQALADNRRGDAIELFMRLVGVPDQGIESMRKSPMWPNLEAVAPTLEYDAAAMGDDRTAPLVRAANVAAKTLVMDGEASLATMPFMRSAAEALCEAIPNACHKSLPGQSHQVDSAILAPVLIEFFES